VLTLREALIQLPRSALPWVLNNADPRKAAAVPELAGVGSNPLPGWDGRQPGGEP
jgi:hypothetical protein